MNLGTLCSMTSLDSDKSLKSIDELLPYSKSIPKTLQNDQERSNLRHGGNGLTVMKTPNSANCWAFF